MVLGTLSELFDLRAIRKGYRDAVIANTALCCCCSCSCGESYE